MSISIEQIPLDKLMTTLREPAWSTGPLYFVGDIGGTNARIGFGHKPAQAHESSDKGPATTPSVHIVFVHFKMTRKHINELTEFFAQILSVIRAEKTGQSILSRITSGALSVPGPVSPDGAEGGPFNSLKGVAHLKDFPTELFPPGKSSMLNDLQAGGYGVAAVDQAGAFADYFTVMWEAASAEQKTGEAASTGLGDGNTFVAAPGTGLGTSLIHHVGRATSNVKLPAEVMSIEFGSATLAFRRNKEAYYMGLSEFIHGKNPKTGKVRLPISEDGCCGGAIVYTYYCLKKQKDPSVKIPPSLRESPTTAEQIVKMAKEKGDAIALKALETAYQSLMATCSEGVMVFLPRNAVIIGDNIVRNSFFFEDKGRVASLQRALHEHPMQDRNFISQTRFLRQSKLINLNLLGCFGFGMQAVAAKPSKL